MRVLFPGIEDHPVLKEMEVGCRLGLTGTSARSWGSWVLVGGLGTLGGGSHLSGGGAGRQDPWLPLVLRQWRGGMRLAGVWGQGQASSQPAALAGAWAHWGLPLFYEVL